MSMFNDGVGEQWELGDAIRIPNLDGDGDGEPDDDDDEDTDTDADADADEA